MKTLLQKHGDDYLLELPGKMLEDCLIDPAEPLEVSAADGVITLLPVGTGGRRARLDAALDDAFKRYGETFRRLAE